MQGPTSQRAAELLPERWDDRITPITMGSAASLRGSWLNTHTDPIAPPAPGPPLARAIFVDAFDPDARIVTRDVRTKMIEEIQQGSHGFSMTWGAFGGAVPAPVLSRFYGKSDGWTLSFDVAFLWLPSTRPSVNRWGFVANPENVSSAVSTRDGHVRGLVTELAGDIVSTDRGHVARYLGQEIVALAVDAKGALATVRLPDDGRPPTSDAPITLSPLGSTPSPAAPWSRLEPDDSPDCRRSRRGFRAILATTGWLRARVDGADHPGQDELLLVRFEDQRLCLEAAEVVHPTIDDPLMIDDTPVSLAPYLVARFSGAPAAARLQPRRDGVTRQPATCELTVSSPE